MLDVARAAVPRGALFMLADHTAALPFLDGAFDLALSGLTYVQDSFEAVAELARVVRPGGRIALSMWAEDYLELQLLNVARGRVGMEPIPPPEPDAAAERLRQAGFEAVERHDLALALGDEASARAEPGGTFTNGWAFAFLVARRR